MKLFTYTGGLVATNAYVLQSHSGTLLIDAPKDVFPWLASKNLTPDALLLTHQHFDHVEDAHLFEGPIYAQSPFSRDLTLDQQARDWGLPVQVPEFSVSILLTSESTITLAGFQISILPLPGHSPDSLVYHIPAETIALAGDTLFADGIGRTDLPHGEHQTLISGIRSTLLTLPPDTRILPGHGPETNIAHEQNNPFLQ
ncbi:MAG: MBL fold metallo-hydrolase [Verrucomicrobiota bacterium]